MSIKGFEVGGVQQQYDYTALDNIPANLVQDANYVHTDNNYTNADKTKLSGIEAQANKTTIDATLTHSGQAADAKATGDAISALNAQVIASMPHDTASGSIASFPDGAAMPVIDCSVAVAPNQDLHGYDNPWPAGGGKNLYNADAIPNSSSGGITATVNNGVITLNGTATSNSYFTVSNTGLSVGTYKFSFNNAIANSDVRVSFRNSDGTYFADAGCYTVNKTLAISNDEPQMVIIYIRSGAVLTNYVIKPQLEVGTAATDFSPFANICPISGWTECKVTRTGENIALSDKWQVGMLTKSGQTSSVLYAQRTLFLPCEPNTSYILKISEEKNIRLFGYETDQSNPRATTSGTAVFGKEASITTGANDAFIRACVWNTDTSVTLNFSDFSPVVLAKDAQTYTIDLDGTRYGGTLDVTTGKLTVDRAMVDMGTLSWNKTSTNVGANRRFVTSDIASSVSPPASVGIVFDCKSSQYKAISINDSWYERSGGIACSSGGVVYITDSTKIDLSAADFKTAMSGVQLVYELATPFEITLTPTQIETLLGTNNIFADCGDTTVDYYADPTLFVNKKIAAAVAAMS